MLKGTSQKVIHKTELEAVKLNIKNADELIIAGDSISSNFKKNKIDLEKFLIQPFIKAKHEILIGGFRDSSFGPMIMFGSGGKYVEVYNDTCLKSAYLCDEDVDEIIERTNIGKILNGVRRKTCRYSKVKGYNKIICANDT